MEATFDSTKPRKTKHCFRQRDIYLVELSKRRLATSIKQTLRKKKRKKKAEKMYEVQGQINGDPRIASTRKEVHRSFVIRPCTLSKGSEDSLEKKKGL